MLTGVRLYSTSKTIDPDELISLVFKEYECHIAQRLHQNTSNTSKGNDRDEAMSALQIGKGKHIKRKPRGVFWNCSDKGHFKNKCPKPTKMLNKSIPQKSSSTTNAAVESDPEEYAFMADELYESNLKLPPLLSNINLDSDNETTGDDNRD